MKERILIIGGGKHANVVAYNLQAQDKYEIAGFVTTEKTEAKSFLGYPLFSSYVNFDKEITENLRKRFATDIFFVGFGSMKYRKDVYNFFIEQRWSSRNIIHPSAIVAPDTRLGNGILIEAGCLITPNPVIGDNVVINTGSQVNHDNVIHNHVYMASGIITSGSIEIEENSLIDDGVIIGIEKKIGKNCIIGAGSVVTKNIPDGVVAYGNPCRVIRINE